MILSMILQFLFQLKSRYIFKEVVNLLPLFILLYTSLHIWYYLVVDILLYLCGVDDYEINKL